MVTERGPVESPIPMPLDFLFVEMDEEESSQRCFVSVVG
jgi:hypothetical protein